ncbi:MAG: excinuclease ABC subunit UvrC [Firmicutes bacterium]|nr:excinuclease ABC subunit UvrC [Bacillota bacterium]
MNDRINEKLQLVPHVPGVYEMRDMANHVIYIGKAKDLFKRLSSYFRKGNHDAKTIALVQRVVDFNYFVCKTENDALALEANLIRRHKPHYNVLLKDNKTFPYILVTDDKIEITRQLHKRGKYFGPYFNGIWASGIMDTIYDLFNVRGKCDPETIANIKRFLSGEDEFNAREVLEQKMNQAAELQQFELAIRYRNGMNFLDKFKERTIANVARNVNCDVFGCASTAQVFVVSVLTVRAGKIIGIQNFSNLNNSPKTDAEKLDEFIGQYYFENIRPTEVVTDAKVGYKKKLVDMANINAQEYAQTSIERIEQKHQFTHGACGELQNVLGFEHNIKRIECFDISHTGGEHVVGSMVVFIDGEVARKMYRKFKIRHTNDSDDYASIYEVLLRRLNRIGGTDESFRETPDLIIADGGKGQLSAAMLAVDNVDNPLSPESFPRDRIIGFTENNEVFLINRSDPIVLDKHSYALRLLCRVRDEAHRFANHYRKTLIKSKGMR